MKLRALCFGLLGLWPLACGSEDDPNVEPDPAKPDSAVVTPPDGGSADASSTRDAKADAEASTDADAAPDAPAPVIDETLVPVECAVTPCVVDITSKGSLHTCARLSDGKVACWGANGQGQLGRDPSVTPNGTRAAIVADLPVVAEVAVGGNVYTNASSNVEGMNGNTCARTESGDVYCWGFNGSALTELTQPTHTPVQLAFPTRAKRLVLGNDLVCAVDDAGALVCAGGKENGDGMVPRTDAGNAPRSVETGAARCASVVGSARNLFCVQPDGTVSSWGFGRSLFPSELSNGVEPSLLGRLSSLTLAPPTQIPRLSRVSSLSASVSHACAVSNGDVLCWGRSDAGQLGVGVRTYEGLPYLVTALEGDYVKQVSTGANVTCSVSALGKIACWGDNRRGQLGRTDVIDSTRPLVVEGLPEMVQVAVLESSVCALAKTGQVHCWGDNGRGQLARGTSDLDAHAIPEPITWEPSP